MGDPSPSSPPRYTAVPMPASRFLPGWGMPRPVPGGDEPLDAEAFLLGVDLFNHRYFWEAHEAWEGPWSRAADPADRLLLHGLIQLAAALLKREVANPRGTRRLAARAGDKLTRARDAGAPDRHMGVDLPGLIDYTRRLGEMPSLPPIVIRLEGHAGGV